MKVKELIEILSKIENQESDIILYDDEMDDYIELDINHCVEKLDDTQIDINFYKEDRQASEVKHNGDITFVKLVENNENVYYYTCPICLRQHKITSEYYEHHMFEKGQDIQTRCLECDKTLYMTGV